MTRLTASLATPDDVDLGRGGACALLHFLEARVERLTEEMAEARTESRGLRYEAGGLRIAAGRARVLAAPVEAERARSAEIRAERIGLATELAEQRRPWVGRVLRAVFDRQPARRRGGQVRRGDEAPPLPCVGHRRRQPAGGRSRPARSASWT